MIPEIIICQNIKKISIPQIEGTFSHVSTLKTTISDGKSKNPTVGRSVFSLNNICAKIKNSVLPHASLPPCLLFTSC